VLNLTNSGFLTAKQIEEISNEKEVIKNAEKDCFDSIMYDLRLGQENYVTPKGKINLKNERDFLTINPGQTAILTTYEYINMPDDLFGLITIKFKHKGKGLINISGFHVDPLFEGHLVFSVYNAGKRAITLSYKQCVFSMIFYKLPTSVNTHKRKITSIPTDILEHFEGSTFPSLLELEKELERIKTHITYLQAIGLGILLTLIPIAYEFLTKIWE